MAHETREGEVYTRLLQKLEVERAALNDQAFMVQFIQVARKEADMAKKTAGVQDLVEGVLLLIPTPHTGDIIEEVFLYIENTDAQRKQYDELLAQLGRDVTNQWIGRYTKLSTGYETAKQVDAKRTKLTTSYSKLIP